MDTAKQMQMAFMEEGGLTDDGTSVDPVSGNEVPPGSMAEEVRDDVPAQLSEGEYVVPADVVRFYGVKFFEDLRGEAKRGLMDMEANGRIGGEPVAQTMDNQTGGELTPEELAALEQITGMAMGGVVQPTQSTDPYLQQQQMYQQPAPVAMGNTTGYNRGGQVLYANNGPDVSTGITNPVTGVDAGIDPYKPQFSTEQASMFSPGFLIDQTLGTSAPEVRTVTMYGPAGEVETLTLPAQMDRYEELLTLGYSETQVETTTETSVRQDEDGGTTVVTQPEKQIEVADIKSEDLEKTAKGLSLLNAVATGLAATVGLPVAAIVNTQAVARYNDILDRMKSEGIETDLERKGSIFGGEESLYAGLKDIDKSGGASFGDTWLGDLLGFDGEAGVQGAGLKDSFGGARRTSDTASTSTTKTQSAGAKAKERQAKNAQAGANLRNLGTNQGDAAARIQETAARTGQSIAEVGRSQAPSSASQSAAQRAAAEGDPRNMNTGGMVKRRSKKKK